MWKNYFPTHIQMERKDFVEEITPVEELAKRDLPKNGSKVRLVKLMNELDKEEPIHVVADGCDYSVMSHRVDKFEVIENDMVLEKFVIPYLDGKNIGLMKFRSLNNVISFIDWLSSGKLVRDGKKIRVRFGASEMEELMDNIDFRIILKRASRNVKLALGCLVENFKYDLKHPREWIRVPGMNTPLDFVKNEVSDAIREFKKSVIDRNIGISPRDVLIWIKKTRLGLDNALDSKNRNAYYSTARVLSWLVYVVV